jgi:hypothetical protein
MRRIALALGAWWGAAAAWAGDGVVYLNGPADLAQLRHSNPGHYQQAVKIMGAANELCRPHAGEIEFTQAQDVSCSQVMLRTSNPAKREITFRLDSIKYIALVAMTDDPPRLVAASPR